MSQYPPNDGQPPWQGNQPQYPPQQPWGALPEQPGQHSFYNQPTQGWQPGQMPLPPMQRPPRRPTLQQRFNALSRRGKLGLGCATIFVILSLCICSATVAANGGTNQQSAPPTTIVAIPSDTPTTTDVQTVLPTDTPTIAPTDTPVATPTATATPTPKPTAAPTQPIQRPTPTPTPHCVAVNNNPWCYNFTPGNLITNPPSAFCSYFTCVSTFWTANHGYVAECANGSYTHSGGVSGACSRDGGVANMLYSH
ncbi:MAG: hypothetical protein ABI396_04145 [Ktedonobacteraceae bacterium]